MSKLNIFPEKIVKTKDSNGNSYRSEVYSLEALANLNLIGFLIVCLILGAILPFISPICLLIYCFTAKGQETKSWPIVVGLLTSLYLIFDIKKEWLISKLIALAYGDKFTMVMPLSVTSVIISLMLLFFGKPLYDITKRNITLPFTIIILFLVIYNSLILFFKN